MPIGMVQLIQLDRKSQVPLYLQIRHQLREMILAGAVPEGTRLQPERKLAERLGVNRGTVTNAYRELVADGLAEARVGRGTVVRRMDIDADGAPAWPAAPPWEELFARQPHWLRHPLLGDLATMAARKNVISLAAGVPAPDLYPTKAFSQVMQDLLGRHDPAMLGPCRTEGLELLRVAIAEGLMDPAAGVGPDEILIVTGSQQGLDLISRAFIEPGDAIVVEAPTYLGALQTFGAAGARLLGAPLDEHGLRLDVLQGLLTRYRPKFIYTLPTCQNPSGVTQSLERRQRLLNLANRHRVLVVEDDPYGPLYYDEAPPAALRVLDGHGRTIYLSTFSKIMFPGLRLGWVAAPRPVIERLSFIKQRVDLYGNSLAQWATAVFIQDDHLDAHLAQVREIYPRRLQAMVDALRRHCRELEFRLPDGGFNLWCRLPAGLKSRDLLSEAGRRGVVFAPGEIFFPGSGGEGALRLNFSSQGEAPIREGIARLGQAVAALQARAVEVPELEQVAEPLV
ncbi:MAG: PLP-dependent aminotransferase family protein [Anaerolineae bacterium]